MRVEHAVKRPAFGPYTRTQGAFVFARRRASCDRTDKVSARRKPRPCESQLFLPVMAKMLLQVRSVFLLPQFGHGAEPVVASEIGREISKSLWQSLQVNS